MPLIYRKRINQFNKFIQAIRFTPEELKEYYGITPNLVELLKNTKDNTIELTEKEQEIVIKVTQGELSKRRIPITKEFRHKLNELRENVGGKKLAHYIHENESTMTSLLRGRTDATTYIIRHKINKAYHDYKCGILKPKPSIYGSGMSVEQMLYEDWQFALAKNKKYFKALEVGKTYRIYETSSPVAQNEYKLVFEGTILEEYDNYYFGKHGDKKVTFMKNLLYLPNYKVEEIKNE